MIVYKSQIVGDGSEEKPYRPAVAGYLLPTDPWVIQDLRPGEEAMLVTCNPSLEQDEAIRASGLAEVAQ